MSNQNNSQIDSFDPPVLREPPPVQLPDAHREEVTPPVQAGSLSCRSVERPEPNGDSAGSELILEQLSYFISEDQVSYVLLKGPAQDDGRPVFRCGYYDAGQLRQLVHDVLQHCCDAEAVFFAINPIDKSVLQRGCNRIESVACVDALNDVDVVRRKWFYIDIDPSRTAGASSTNQEKEAAFSRAIVVADHLSEKGFPEPVLTDSGNGFHLYYRVDLTRESDLPRRLLRTLKRRFSDEECKIDTAVSNPARVTKLYGTVARKGPNTSDRPHRRSSIVRKPSQRDVLEESTLRCYVDESERTDADEADSRIANEVGVTGQAGVSLSRPDAALLSDASAYIGKIPAAVEGKGGDEQTFVVACKLIQGFALTVDEALPILLEYNNRCEPRWERSDLVRKLELADSEDVIRGELRIRRASRSSKSQAAVSSVITDCLTDSLPGPEFPFFVPDWLLLPTNFVLYRFSIEDSGPKRGRRSKHIGFHFDLLTWLARQRSPSWRVVVPDEALKLCLYGIEAPKNWSSGLNVKLAEANHAAFQQALFKKKQFSERLNEDPFEESYPGEQSKVEQGLAAWSAKLDALRGLPQVSFCPAGCILHDSSVDHSHYRVQLNVDALDPEIQRLSSDGVHVDFDRQDENGKLVREQLIKNGAMYRAYLPALLFGYASGFTMRQTRLISAITREQTRTARPTGKDRRRTASIVDRGRIVARQGRDMMNCSYLDPDRRYVGFNGNLRSAVGSGYRFFKRSQEGQFTGGWLFRAGYAIRQARDVEAILTMIKSFLKDLTVVSEPLGLISFGLTRTNRIISMDEFHRAAKKGHIELLFTTTLRVYTEADYLVRWRQFYSGELGFGYIPGGDWEVKQVAPKLVGRRHRTRMGVIRELERQGLTQKQFSESIGWSSSAVSRQLSEKRERLSRSSSRHRQFLEAAAQFFTSQGLPGWE